MGECTQCGKKGLLLKTRKVACELNGGRLPLSYRTGGEGSGTKVEACASSGDFCEECIPQVPVAPVLLSLFDEETFLGGGSDEFLTWLREPSKKERLVTHLHLCSPRCLETLVKGRVRTRLVRSDVEVRWSVKVSAQTYRDRSGSQLRYVSLFWYGEPGAHAMPGGMFVRHSLPTKESCQVFDETFGGPLAPLKDVSGGGVPNLSEGRAESGGSEEMFEGTTATAISISYEESARAAEADGRWDESVKAFELARLPEEARRVRLEKAGALAQSGRFKESAEVYEVLRMRAEAKAMRKRDFERQATESGFEEEKKTEITAGAVPSENSRPAPAIASQADLESGASDPSRSAPSSSPRRPGWIVCPSCRKVLGKGFGGTECTNCGKPLVSETRAP